MLTVLAQYKSHFEAELAKLHAAYSEIWKGPGEYIGKPMYHYRLHHCEAHAIYGAFVYANALLLTGADADLQRAIEVLRQVMSFEDMDPASQTYGIWPWFMEESLEEMAEPCWNFAEFDGKAILQVLLFHAERMPEDLIQTLRKGLRAACMSIFRRNMNPGYTNISIMGSYVTLCAGQLLEWDEMFRYGMSRFEKSWDYTMKNGTFAEYNSATYTPEAIEDLSRIYAQIEDKDVRRRADDMLDVAWCTAATHFHAPTKQWVGPNARSYTWLTADETLSFLRVALGNDKSLIGDDRFVYNVKWPYLEMHCPEKYHDAFKTCTPHDENIGFTRGNNITEPRTHIAIAHLTPKYTLSSWERMDTWNQCRNLTGYWGGDKPRFINATILHDLYDFSSGMFITAQQGGNALIMGTLVTNGGDTHCNLDMVKNETIKAYDLRMRIELGGAIENAPKLCGNTVTLSDADVEIRIELLDGACDGRPVTLEINNTQWDIAQQAANQNLYRRFVGDEARWYVDVVFYHGEYKEIKLSDLKNAFAVLSVSMEGVAPEAVQLEKKGDYICAAAKMAGTKLFVCSPEAPIVREKWNGWAEIDDVPLRKTYGLPMDKVNYKCL